MNNSFNKVELLKYFNNYSEITNFLNVAPSTMADYKNGFIPVKFNKKIQNNTEVINLSRFDEQLQKFLNFRAVNNTDASLNNINYILV